MERAIRSEYPYMMGGGKILPVYVDRPNPMFTFFPPNQRTELV